MTRIPPNRAFAIRLIRNLAFAGLNSPNRQHRNEVLWLGYASYWQEALFINVRVVSPRFVPLRPPDVVSGFAPSREQRQRRINVPTPIFDIGAPTSQPVPRRGKANGHFRLHIQKWAQPDGYALSAHIVFDIVG